jgi:hypothetical protein
MNEDALRTPIYAAFIAGHDEVAGCFELPRLFAILIVAKLQQGR